MFKIVCVEAPTYTQGILIKDKYMKQLKILISLTG